MIPIYRAKSKEQKNTYVEGLLIGIDEEIGLCTIRTKDDYIGGELCYLDTLSIHFPDMLDTQGNKIFASLQEDGKGGDILKHINHIYQDDMPVYNPYYKKGDIKIDDIPLKSYTNMPNLDYYKIVGIQQ